MSKKDNQTQLQAVKIVNYSLIVPHYDDTDRLERLLRSVPLERDDIEVIVVDDCTPDQQGLDLVRQRWPRVRWLSTPENAGAGVRNKSR
jgi:GT2 family glycosyltransferase